MTPHWLLRVARRNGLEALADVDVPADTPNREAWTLVAAAAEITPAELAKRVAAHFRLELADFSQASQSVLKLVPESIATRFQVLPLREDDRSLVVATSNPTDADAEQAIGFASGRSPLFEIAPPDVVAEAIVAGYTPDRAVEQFLSRVDSSVGSLVRLVEEEEDAPAQGALAADAAAGPVVKLTNIILDDAIRQGASDIHIQPTPTGGVVRFRVDGVLRVAAHLPLPVMIRVVARIKVIGKLDIADRLRPQDGRVRIAFGDRRFDLRISTVPTRSVEKVVIRILDPSRSLNLAQLGLVDPEGARLRRLLTQRDGIVVVTGPTGSGKTTTMYAAIGEIATEGINIMTVEDPVEYELPGITQIQVEVKQGVTFASALRAMLRQDPDVIFVGEIRDRETAEMALQAALTGHLVLATLHTNDAVGAIRRLSDLGLDRAAIGQTLRGAVAQRLVRSVCHHCSVQIAPGSPLTDEELRLAEEYDVRPVVRAVGCDHCAQTGYLGRQVLLQVFTVTPGIEGLIANDASHGRLLLSAQSAGMRTLRKVGAERVRDGVTTLDELERVLGDVDVGSTDAGAGETALPAEHEPDVQPEPAVSAPAPAPKRGAENGAPAEAPAAEPITALVVDDDAGTRIIARALLESLGHEVTEASDGEAALEMLRDGEFGLLVLDLEMPRTGGREVLSAVRRQVRSAGIPVIVLTGALDPAVEIEVLDAGADDYIHKPLDPSRFLTRVKATLRRAHA